MHINKRRMFKSVRTSLILLFTLGIGATLYTLWTLSERYTSTIYTSANLITMPSYPLAIVFGAGYWPNGTLSMVLKDRLDAAIELYHAERVQKLLFSGDNRFVHYNEPAKMLEYALAQGVPREAIILDYAGRRTYDTCYRAREIFKVPAVILVTNRYHLPRALNTCHALDLEAIGYVADRHTYPRRDITWYWIREIPALWRAWWDLYLGHPVPILGEPLPIFKEGEE